MIGVLSTQNNLRVKNARQPVKRKAILHFYMRSGTQNKKTFTHRLDQELMI